LALSDFAGRSRVDFAALFFFVFFMSRSFLRRFFHDPEERVASRMPPTLVA
jgi:hypothetical protein